MTQADLLDFAITALEQGNLPYMVVGSLAAGAYGEPRMTRDIDIVVVISLSQVDIICQAFGSDDFYLSREAATEAIRHGGQFNVLHPATGNKIDFMIARDDPWGREQIARRARLRLLPNREGYAARPEDIILSKMLYYREGGSEKHLRDITGILKVSGEAVDRDYVSRWAASLDVMEIWTALLNKLKI